MVQYATQAVYSEVFPRRKATAKTALKIRFFNIVHPQL